jgi:hypothetical protein
MLIEQPTWSRAQIDEWPIISSGLNARVVNCLERAGVETIGDLRAWSDRRLLGLDHFGEVSAKNVHWFFNWAKRLETGNNGVLPMPALLHELLDPSESHVLEERYGLNDPLFRPLMRRRTLREIAAGMRGLTRERVRQIEADALTALRTNLGRAMAAASETYWVRRIQSCGHVVTTAELVEWADDPMLGGCQPWGALLLLSEAHERITFRHDYFTSLPQPLLNQVEKQILLLLDAEGDPVPFERILARVAGTLSMLDTHRPRLLTVLLDHHPAISGTIERRYFRPATSASGIVADILRQAGQPLHFHELTRRYNERMQPHSHRGTGYILRVLNELAGVRRVSRGVYQLKPR